MRFLADENVSRLVVERIRSAGFEVIAVGATRPAASDKDVLAIAAALNASSTFAAASACTSPAELACKGRRQYRPCFFPATVGWTP